MEMKGEVQKDKAIGLLLAANGFDYCSCTSQGLCASLWRMKMLRLCGAAPGARALPCFTAGLNPQGAFCCAMRDALKGAPHQGQKGLSRAGNVKIECVRE